MSTSSSSSSASSESSAYHSSGSSSDEDASPLPVVPKRRGPKKGVKRGEYNKKISTEAARRLIEAKRDGSEPCWVVIHSDGKGIRTFGRLPEGLTSALEDAATSGGGIEVAKILPDAAPYYQVVSHSGHCYGIIEGEKCLEGLVIERSADLKVCR
ncbi:hypothetical protein FOL47_009430, partial [Perkinsus chesapeaki]